MSRNSKQPVPTDGVIYPETIQERGLPLDHDTPSRATRDAIMPDLLENRDIEDTVGYCRLALQDAVRQDEPIYYALYNLASSRDWCNKCFTKYLNLTFVALAGEMLIADAREPTERMMDTVARDALDVMALEYMDLFDQQGVYDCIDTDRLYDMTPDLERGADITAERTDEYQVYEEEQRRGSRGRRSSSRYDDYDDYDDEPTTRRTGRSSSRGSITSLSSRSKYGSFRSNTVKREPTYVAPSTVRRDRDLEREELREQRLGGRTTQGRINRMGRRNRDDDIEETSSRFPNGKKFVTNNVNTRTNSRAARCTGPTTTVTTTVEEEYNDDDIIIVDGIEIPANTRYGTIIGHTPDNVPIVYTVRSKGHKKQVGNLNNTQQEDLLGGPVEVIKFGGSEGAVRQTKDDTMNEGRSYNRRERSYSETRDGVKTTRYDREAPAQEGSLPVPQSVDELVIDPYYYRKPTNEKRPFDAFFNPGGVLLYSRAVFLKSPDLEAVRDAWKRPLRAFNPYTQVAFIAVFPTGKVCDVVVPKTEDMDYLTHELRGELRESNRLRSEGIVLPENEPATYSAHVPKPKTDLTEEEAMKTQVMNFDLPMSPVEAVTEAERIAAKYDEDNDIPSNLVYTVVSPLDVSVVGQTNLDAVRSLRDCATFKEVGQRLVDLRKDNVIDQITFDHIDSILLKTFNRVVFETYSSNMFINEKSYFVDYIDAADKWLIDNVGEYIAKHYPALQRSLIGQLFNFELIHHADDVIDEVEEGLEEAEKESSDSGFVSDDGTDAKEVIGDSADKDDIFADENNVESEGLVASKSIDDLVKEALSNENERFHLRVEHRTAVARINLNASAFGSVISESEKQGGEYLPAQQYPILVKLLASVLDNVVALRLVLITNDGKQFNVSKGADNRSVIMALTS